MRGIDGRTEGMEVVVEEGMVVVVGAEEKMIPYRK